MGVRQVRYTAKHEHCIQCGLCVRMCEEQMMAGAIGFAGRGANRRVSRPFDMTDERCRQCGACLYVCPVSELRCAGPAADTTLCDGCRNFAPVCFQSYGDAMCFLDLCHACELAGPLRPARSHWFWRWSRCSGCGWVGARALGQRRRPQGPLQCSRLST